MEIDTPSFESQEGKLRSTEACGKKRMLEDFVDLDDDDILEPESKQWILQTFLSQALQKNQTQLEELCMSGYDWTEPN